MKSFFLFLILITNSLSMAANKIIDYRYGNQITGSTLTVFDDGSVAHSERTCCPPRTDHLSKPNLSQESIAQLLLWIDLASQASQSTFGAGLSGNGSSSGELIAFDKNSKYLIIRTIEFGDGKGSPQPVHFNTAPESREIEKFVFSLVTQKMSY